MRIRNILRDCGFKFYRPTIVSIVGENAQGQIDDPMNLIVEVFDDEIRGSTFQGAVHQPKPGCEVLHVWWHTRTFGPAVRPKGEPMSCAVTLQIPSHAELIRADEEYVIFYEPNSMVLFSQKEEEIRRHRIGEARESMHDAEVELIGTFKH